jgi:hypothetical protein
MFPKLIRQHQCSDKSSPAKGEPKYDEPESMPLLPGVHLPSSLLMLRRLHLSGIQLTRSAA